MSGLPRQRQLPRRAGRSLRLALAPGLAVLWLGRASPALAQDAGHSSPRMNVAENQALGAIRALIDARQYSSAAAEARRVLDSCERESGPESLPVASVLDLLVEALYNLGTKNDEELLQHLPSDHPDLGESLRHLGVVYRQLERYPESQGALERAVGIHRNAASSATARAHSLQDLATTLTQAGLYDEAKEKYEQVLQIAAAGGVPDPLLAKTLYNFARLHNALGNYERAKECYQGALDIAKKLPDKEGVAYASNGLGNLHMNLGEYNAARRCHATTLALADSLFGSGHRLVHAALHNLGNSNAELGDYLAARKYYRRALALADSMHRGEQSSTAKTVARLAVVEFRAGEYLRAVQLHERATRILEGSVGPDHPDLALQLLDQAKALRALDRLTEARSLLERSLSILERHFGPANEHVGFGLEGLAETERRAGDLERAKRHYELARATLESNLGDRYYRLTTVLVGLGLVLAESGDPTSALDLALRAEEIARSHTRLVIRSLPEREAMGYSSQVSGGLDLALTIAASSSDPDITGRVWDALIRSRAMVLEEMAWRHSIASRDYDPSVQSLVDSLEHASRSLANLTLRRSDAESAAAYASELARARAQYEGAQRALAESSARFRDRFTQEQAGLAEVREKMPPQSALVAYTRYNHDTLIRDAAGILREKAEPEPSFLAFVLRGGATPPMLVPLGSEARLDSLVVSWRQEASRPALDASRDDLEVAYRRAGEALRRQAFDPINTNEISRLFVVPEGALNTVSFATLPLGESRYLVDLNIQFHYLSAERDLVRMRRPQREARKYLVLGDPAFDLSMDSKSVAAATRSGDCDDLATLAFPRLPGTKQEAESLQALLERHPNGAEVLLATGAAATEAWVKRNAPGAGSCHLATHAFNLPAQCTLGAPGTRSVQGLARGRSDFDALALENPMLFTGLVLAGAQQQDAILPDQDDGFLTAEEITALDLTNVGWAVLSACETGLGAVRFGEGVFGLRRAFQVAGARTVIMSLWSVRDKPTRDWMLSLYTHRLAGADTPAALAGASHTVLAERRRRGTSTHPFYWGAFIASGDWQ